MARLDRPALRGTLLGSVLRLWNPIMKRLLASPLHWPWSRWFLVIGWTGRKTGRTYRTPVSYVREGDELLVTTGDAWWRNLIRGTETRIWLAGREQQASAEVVDDEQESLALHERMFARRPLFATLAGMPRAPDSAQVLRAIRAGRKVIRLRPS
jgi:deazaflavin-dependent oxidoreductase (nitroreductase family)